MNHQSVLDTEIALRRSVESQRTVTADEVRKLKILEGQAETLARVRYLVEHACDRPRRTRNRRL